MSFPALLTRQVHLIGSVRMIENQWLKELEIHGRDCVKCCTLQCDIRELRSEMWDEIAEERQTVLMRC